MLFFDLWWKKQIDEKNAERLIRNAGELADYLRYKRLVAKYSLTEPEEKIINTDIIIKIHPEKISNPYHPDLLVNKNIVQIQLVLLISTRFLSIK